MPCAQNMMTLEDKRQSMRHLLDENSPADAQAFYYAFHHGDQNTQLITLPPKAGQASGYICLARTGMDLFRPLVTFRLPEDAHTDGVNLEAGTDLIFSAIPEGMPVILSSPPTYRPLIGALFVIETEETFKTLVFDRGRFRPIINVLVTRSDSHDGLPRFVARERGRRSAGRPDEIIASAGVNWQTPRYADIYVRTKTPHQKQGLGQSVVASLVQFLLNAGRKPLYRVVAHNKASIRLAEAVGFVDVGLRDLLIEGSLKPRPAATRYR